MCRGRELFRLRSSDGVFDNWPGRSSASLEIRQIWEGRGEAAQLPLAADGMDVCRGSLYLAFSDTSFNADDVRSWKEFGIKLLEGGPLADRLLGDMNLVQRKRLVDFIVGKLPEERALQGYPKDRFDFALLQGLNAMRLATDVAPDAATLAGGERARANRRFLEKTFAPCLMRRKTDFLAVCSAKSGKLQRIFDMPQPTGIRAVSDRLVYVLCGGTTVMALDPRSGKTKPVVTGLSGAVGLAVDAAGQIFVGLGEPTHQVRVFSAGGRPVRSIGRTGGRPRLGPWQGDGVLAISALAIDHLNRLWVTENDFNPKRISVWDVAEGRLLKEFFGATHYGASGGAINPRDPNLMIGVGCEWRFDPQTQTFCCTGVFDRAYHGYAVFCTPSNGRHYLAVNFEVEHNRSGVRIFERLGEGNYVLRAEFRPDYPAGTTTVWSDVNGDGKQDPAEKVSVPAIWITHGSNGWSMNMNPRDLTVYPIISDGKTRRVYQLPLAGFTACGAPRWDVTQLRELSFAAAPDVVSVLPSPDGRLLLTCGERSSYRCYEMAGGRLLWTYPNPFFQVHGSHRAPAAEPGLTRGAYGFVGAFTLPQTGTVWAINANLGEWYLLTEKGYFLARIFEGDPMQWQWPAEAAVGADMTRCPPGSGGEDFGGSLAQAADGKVYLQSGKQAVWCLELGNLDRIATIGSGAVTLRSDEQSLAQAEFERQNQVAVGTRACEVPHLTPAMTGNLPADFKAARLLEYKKSDDAAVKSALAWNEKCLYLGFDVSDNSPWVNGAKEPAQMYVGGDTVDFQFGSDPKADRKRSEAVLGDFRISIGNCLGRPTAVLYRQVSTLKQPRNFTSGVVRQFSVDYVAVLSDARIEVHVRPDRRGYVVEAAVPWSALGFTPLPGTLYRGDLGVTHGTAGGDRTRLRTYWSNQETGLVDDAVFELKLAPKNWGQIVFSP